MIQELFGQTLREMAQDLGMCITVVRPPLVYGAGAKGNFDLLVKAVMRGVRFRLVRSVIAARSCLLKISTRLL
jgi:UDP-glucose 4-epimerase